MEKHDKASYTISILSDNRAAGPDRFGCEHGLSVLLRTPSAKILMDTGASGLFAVNAALIGIDLSDIDYVFLSHGHSDHVGGLKTFLDLNGKAKVIVSPEAVSGRFYSARGRLHSISCDWPLEEMQDRTLFMDGLLYTGCAHNGLENILEACPWPVHTVIGGFHLLDSDGVHSFESEDQLTALAERLVTRYPRVSFLTGHCTGSGVFRILQAVMGSSLKQFACGMQL